MRACLKCGSEKSEDAFRLRKSHSTGKHYRGRVCRACHQAKSAEWRAANIDAVRASVRRSYTRNADKHRAKGLDYHYMRKFGMTRAEKVAMVVSQGGCAICRTVEPRGRGWCVDHDHKTGRVRGILCAPCNIAIGHFAENTRSMAAAIKYLESHRDICSDDVQQT